MGFSFYLSPEYGSD